MTPHEIRAGLTVDPFETTVSRLQDEWLVVWSHDGLEAGRATFREVGEDIEWTRFYVIEGFRKKGIYTQALRWSIAHDGKVTAAPTIEPETWAGFKVTDEGLKLDKRIAKGRVSKKHIEGR